MSIVCAMLRMCAVQAMRGATIAGAHVVDSTIEALADIMGEAQQPALLVRIDQSIEPGQNEGLFARSSTVTLALDLIVASRVTFQSADGAPVTEIVIDPTDAGLEFSLDVLDRQWRRALSDPQNAFAEGFRKLVGALGPIKSGRGVDPESGRKHAIRMIEIEIEPIYDPAPGDELPAVVDEVLTLLATIADYQPAVGICRSELGKGSALLSWQKLQSAMMATAPEPAMLGIGPPDEGEIVPLEEFTAVINGNEGASGDDILPEPDDGGAL